MENLDTENVGLSDGLVNALL